MNKRIFLTLAVTLVAGAILYKMPSRAGEEMTLQEQEAPITVPSMDEQDSIREKEKAQLKSDLGPIGDYSYFKNMSAESKKDLAWKQAYYNRLDGGTLNTEQNSYDNDFKNLVYLLDEDTQYLKTKIKMLEEKIAVLEAFADSCKCNVNK